MKTMTSTEIRKMWYDFFEQKGHKRMASAPLIPINDDSLLWINAGVTPLKKYFDGSEVPENRRIVSVQKCIRTNDIENVGMTARHQTFFEMMGNFSVGDYFKEEAIEFAYELLTSPEWFAIDKDKLYFTVYSDDEATYQKWISLGVDSSHIARLEGNFWEIGEGPCGPDSEIFYDRGEKYDPDNTALEKFRNDENQERYIEIWNNVFSQFNSKEGVPREEYKELPSKNIDTGAGLERWACVFQNVDSNFDTDLFVPIIKKIEELSGVLYNGDASFKIIADHIRAITVALSDGAIFENVGRGYVLRRLLRRSVRMGKKLGMNQSFMYKLVDTVISTMEESYPELRDNQGTVETLVYEEEELFHKTLAAGERRLLELMEKSADKKISGEETFKLYDTYGFPYELTLEYLEEKGYTTSKEEFDQYMNEQKQLAKSSRKQEANMNIQNEALLNFKKPSEFIYSTYTQKGKIIGIFDQEKELETLDKEGFVILDKTCFYAESGGQVSDTGMLIGDKFKARVLDVIKAPNGQHLHKVKVLDGTISLGTSVKANIDEIRRKQIEANHSSVHILQYALRTLISDKIHQAGSKVDENSLRFDFTYTGKILDEKVSEIENFINNLVSQEIDSKTEIMSIEEAKKTNAMALFGEKYQDKVRVVSIGDSKELCGGTHIKNTNEINRIAIVSVESKGSNVYRIEAVTNDKIEDALMAAIKPYNDEKIKLLMKARNIITRAKAEGIELEFDINIDNKEPNSYSDIIKERNELEYTQASVKELEKTYQAKKQEKALKNTDTYEQNITTINDVSVLIMKVENQEVEILKNLADNLLNKMGKGFIFFANVKGENVNFIARSNIETSAGNIVKMASIESEGNGGGSKTFAQGGGKTTRNLDKIFENIKEEIKA
ncbi:MAG: alanine--tRNA ligase [Firmicutes bacterium]|nr:alanine--tRNA ligase [Bacillota bacterium]